jgi:hypothetical protein
MYVIFVTNKREKKETKEKRPLGEPNSDRNVSCSPITPPFSTGLGNQRERVCRLPWIVEEHEPSSIIEVKREVVSTCQCWAGNWFTLIWIQVDTQLNNHPTGTKLGQECNWVSKALTKELFKDTPKVAEKYVEGREYLEIWLGEEFEGLSPFDP